MIESNAKRLPALQ